MSLPPGTFTWPALPRVRYFSVSVVEPFLLGYRVAGGIDIFYPPENEARQRRMFEVGLVVSELAVRGDRVAVSGTLTGSFTVDDVTVATASDDDAEAAVAARDRTGDEGDTLGGVIEVRVEGLPFGLGTHAQWDRKLDGRLAPCRARRAEDLGVVALLRRGERDFSFSCSRSPACSV